MIPLNWNFVLGWLQEAPRPLIILSVPYKKQIRLMF